MTRLSPKFMNIMITYFYVEVLLWERYELAVNIDFLALGEEKRSRVSTLTR